MLHSIACQPHVPLGLCQSTAGPWGPAVVAGGGAKVFKLTPTRGPLPPDKSQAPWAGRRRALAVAIFGRGLTWNVTGLNGTYTIVYVSQWHSVRRLGIPKVSGGSIGIPYVTSTRPHSS